MRRWRQPHHPHKSQHYPQLASARHASQPTRKAIRYPKDHKNIPKLSKTIGKLEGIQLTVQVTVLGL